MSDNTHITSHASSRPAIESIDSIDSDLPLENDIAPVPDTSADNSRIAGQATTNTYECHHTEKMDKLLESLNHCDTNLRSVVQKFENVHARLDSIKIAQPPVAVLTQPPRPHTLTTSEVGTGNGDLRWF